MLVLVKQAQNTKSKHETNYGEVEYNTPVETLYISDNEVNSKMKTITTKMTTTQTT